MDNHDYILRRLNRETRLNEIAWLTTIDKNVVIATYRRIFTPKKYLEFRMIFYPNALNASTITVTFVSNRINLYHKKISNDKSVSISFMSLVNTILLKEESRRGVEI